MESESTPLLRRGSSRKRSSWWRRGDVVVVTCCIAVLVLIELYGVIVPVVYESHAVDPSWVNTYGEGDAIQQVFVVPGSGASHYVVNWVTFNTGGRGPSLVTLLNNKQNFTSTPILFTDKPECPTVTRVIHAVEVDITDLTPPIYYKATYGKQSRVLHFTPTPTDGALRVTMFGDLSGMSYGKHSDTSIPLLKMLSNSNRTDLIIHIGDIAYNLDDDCGRIGDGFMIDIEPVASKTPYVFGPGNHEAEKWEMASYNHYVHRYRGEHAMGRKSGSNSNRWFSFNSGIVHFVVLDADAWANRVSFGRADAQISWLSTDLSRVNRTETPWVVVLLHRALYCTKTDDAECNSEAMSLRVGRQYWFSPVGIEDVLLRNAVDVVVSGHTHHYERTFPVARGTRMASDYMNPKGTVHIQSGIGGGVSEDYFVSPQQPWEAFRDTTYQRGVNQATFHNSTHATFTQLNLSGHVVDEFSIVQQHHGGPW